MSCVRVTDVDNIYVKHHRKEIAVFGVAVALLTIAVCKLPIYVEIVRDDMIPRIRTRTLDSSIKICGASLAPRTSFAPNRCIKRLAALKVRCIE